MKDKQTSAQEKKDKIALMIRSLSLKLGDKDFMQLQAVDIKRKKPNWILLSNLGNVYLNPL